MGDFSQETGFPPESDFPQNIETRLFIDNDFVESSAKKTFQLYDPATEKPTVKAYEADRTDVNRAVEAAKAAFSKWSLLGGLPRAQYLLKLAELLERDNDVLGRLEAISMGRPLGTYTEGFGSARFCRYVAGLVPNVRGESSLLTEHFVNLTMRQPYGVCAAITPWNAPITMLTFKLAPCIGAGNTIVVKPSEKAPLTALHFAKLVQEAGIPKGVVNVLNGHGEPCGKALASHTEIRKISFTGSIAAGRAIQVAAALSNLKQVTLELGGKSPLIVFEDANVDRAAECAAGSILLNSGQACTASSRVYVQDTIADAFCEKLVEEIQARGTNPKAASHPLLRSTVHGPHPDKKQYDHIMSHITDCKDAGYKILIGGGREGTTGYFIEPTIVYQPDDSCRSMREEIFGSVQLVSTFVDEEEVLNRANSTEYGLYASVFTKDIARALRIAKRFEAGNVGVNVSSPFQVQDMPFNGWKQSGSGKELGKTCVDDWTETKTCYMSLET